MQIGVLDITKRTDVCGRYGSYIKEILGHAGFPYRVVTIEALAETLSFLGILVLPAHVVLDDCQQQLITQFVESGHVLIALGGTSGLDVLCGCHDHGPVNEAWVGTSGVAHQVTAALPAPLHAFGGRQIEALAGVAVLASWLDGDCYSTENGWLDAAFAPAITLRNAGRGYALVVAADLVQSIVRIQQGVGVHVDGCPAPDGSAPVNDGILKVDDGLVLDYTRDRVPVGNTQIFGYGIADAWRELLLRALLWSAAVIAMPLPVLWYWPNHLQAIGLISHDSDVNDPILANMLLDNLQNMQISSTWCIQYPGGYAPAFYRKLVSLGYELALHFDANVQKDRRSWQENDFRLQVGWLTDIADQHPISNKNHILRWEGVTEFFSWMERAGMKADQSKGPSKTGNMGFPFGGSHPWFPMHEHTLQMIDVLEINLSSQDLVLTCPYEVGPVVVDWAKTHYGVAHLLFHPAHADKPQVAAALRNVVTYGREQGLPWWTCAQIQEWERLRRQVRLEESSHGGWTVSSTTDVPNATLLWFGAGAPVVKGSYDTKQVHVYDFPAVAQVIDLSEKQVWLG